ncbi:MAG: GPW/gp25 family protein [Azonexus sp.]
MLYLTDTNGDRQTGITLSYKETGGEHGSVVTLTARAIETDRLLVGRFLSALIQWNDGTGDSVSFPVTSLNAHPLGYWEITSSKRLLPGKYVCVLRVQNYRSPVEDVVRMNFFVTVTAAKPTYNPPKLVFGPILPRDSGFPNNEQWSFDIDSDLIVLESSVKMLLLTSKGDRVMVPDYGTNIRRILFDMNLKSTESLLREEIVAAFAQWEPRVELVALDVNLDPNGRNVTLALSLVSRLNRQAFETRVQYNR